VPVLKKSQLLTIFALPAKKKNVENIKILKQKQKKMNETKKKQKNFLLKKT